MTCYFLAKEKLLFFWKLLFLASELSQASSDYMQSCSRAPSAMTNWDIKLDVVRQFCSVFAHVYSAVFTSLWAHRQNFSFDLVCIISLFSICIQAETLPDLELFDCCFRNTDRCQSERNKRGDYTLRPAFTELTHRSGIDFFFSSHVVFSVSAIVYKKVIL